MFDSLAFNLQYVIWSSPARTTRRPLDISHFGVSEGSSSLIELNEIALSQQRAHQS